MAVLKNMALTWKHCLNDLIIAIIRLHNVYIYTHLYFPRKIIFFVFYNQQQNKTMFNISTIISLYLVVL